MKGIANILLAAIVALVGLWLVLVEGNLGMAAVALAFGGCIWLLYAIVREATRKSSAEAA